MRNLSAEEIAALQSRAVAARDYIWITVKDRETGEPESVGFWNDVGDVLVEVIDGVTGAPSERAFLGAHSLVSIGPIPMTADITVRTVDVMLAHTDDVVELLVRGYDARNAPIQIYRGLHDPVTLALIAAPKPRFVGFVDTAPIVTPAEGGEGSLTLRCVSITRELTLANPDVCSHESQLARHPGDDFYKDTAVVGEWELAWGQKRGKAKS